METKSVITLYTIKSWSEKSKHYPPGTLRIYCGKDFIGIAEPSLERGDLFKFESFYPCIIKSFTRFDSTEQQILDHCESCLKGFIYKVCKKKSILIPLEKSK